MVRKKRPPLPILQILFLVILICFGALFYYFWQNGKFGKFDRFNLILQGTPVILVSLDPKEHSVTVVRFPDDLYVLEVVPNYGAYKMASVYKVGELDRRGGLVLSWTVSGLLGVPVDGYLVVNRRIGAQIKSFFLSPRILFDSPSDLNFFDRVRFVLALEQVRFDKINEVDLGKMATALVLADGSAVLGVDKEQLDSLFAGYFGETGLREEGKRVEVLNSTPVVGLGNRAARVLTNIGLSVINVGSISDTLSQCEVRTNNIKSLTVRRMANIFSCKIITRAVEDRADVTLVLSK